MEKHLDGPQSATRNAKDRRPTYSTKGARSLASIEQRLSRLEGKPAASPTSLKHSAALDLDADLNNFGLLFNGLEERVAEIEKTGLGDFVESRLHSVIDARIQPFVVNNKVHSETRTLVNDYEASLREFSSRLLHLEDHNELAKAQELSTSDIAKALLQRLRRGDVIAPSIKRDVHMASDSTTNGHFENITALRPRMPGTPATDKAAAQQNTVEDSVEAADEPPKKRRRNKQQSPRAATAASRRRDSEPPLQGERDSYGFRSGGLATNHDENAAKDVDMEEVVIPPEVRRTSRKHVPAKHNEDMVPWREANQRLRASR